MYGNDFEPDDVTAHVGLAPTRTLQRGQRRPDLDLPRQSSWEVSNGKVEHLFGDVYEMSDLLVDRLAPFLGKLVEAKNMFDLRRVFQAVLWIDQNEDTSMPSIASKVQSLVSYMLSAPPLTLTPIEKPSGNDGFGARGTDGSSSATFRSDNVAYSQRSAYDCWPG